MGARGPLPKSGEARRREGNPAHRPLPPAPTRSGGSGLFGDLVERPRGLSAAGARLWDLYAPDLAAKGALRAAWIPGLMAACEFEAELLRDERQYSREQRKAQKVAKAEKREYAKSREDWLEKRELLARRRVLSRMKEEFVLTPKSDSRFAPAEGSVIPSGVAMAGMQAMSEEVHDPFSVVQ